MRLCFDDKKAGRTDAHLECAKGLWLCDSVVYFLQAFIELF